MGNIISGQSKDTEEIGKPNKSSGQLNVKEEKNSDHSRNQEERGKTYISLLGLAINDDTQKATCRVKIPSNELSQYDDPVGADPVGVLVVKNADNTHCINMMTQCIHRNILHVLVAAEKDQYVEVWTESFTGPLIKYLESSFRTLSMSIVSDAEIMLPTFELQSSISQIFDGLEHIWLLGKYHGNFSLENTYYDILGSEIVVKLMDFKRKGRRLSIYWSCASWEEEGQYFDCYQIDHLAKKLKEFSWGDLPYIKQEIRGHPFFWDFNATNFFFVSEIPYAMNSGAFRNKVNACKEICTLPWDGDDYDGLIKQMDNYHLRKGMDRYDKNSRLGYV